MTFNLNLLLFAECTELVDQAVQSVGLNVQNQIVPSRDPKVVPLRKTLETTNISNGFQKWKKYKMES